MEGNKTPLKKLGDYLIRSWVGESYLSSYKSDLEVCTKGDVGEIKNIFQEITNTNSRFSSVNVLILYINDSVILLHKSKNDSTFTSATIQNDDLKVYGNRFFIFTDLGLSTEGSYTIDLKDVKLAISGSLELLNSDFSDMNLRNSKIPKMDYLEFRSCITSIYDSETEPSIPSNSPESLPLTFSQQTNPLRFLF